MAPTSEPEPTTRPPCSLNGADWGASDAKHLMVQDMMDGLVPLEPIKDVKKLFDKMYAHQPEFKDFPFDAERYKDRISRLQSTVKKLKWARDYDEECLKEARAKYPKQTHAPNGVILWDGSEADYWLKIDMEQGLHESMKRGDFFDSRDCYKPMGRNRFSKRIDQLTEAAKPYGENPMQVAAKREKKQIKKIKNRPKYSRQGKTDPYINE